MQKLSLFFSDKRISVLLVILNILTLGFIFSRSLMPSDLSADESGFVMNIFNNCFNMELSDHFVRKAAHFTEFFALGFISSFTVFSFSQKAMQGTFLKLFICLFSAVIDEFLQLSSDGRSGQVTDVLLDFSGGFTGIIISLLIILIYSKGLNKNGKHKNQ